MAGKALGLTTHCGWCGKEIPTEPSKLRKQKNQFCDVACWYQYRWGITQIPELKPEELSYVAGFFDGEGCVYAGYRRGKNGNRNGCVLNAEIANCDKGILEMFREWFGGSLNPHYQSPRWKVRWQWDLASRQAEAFLTAILPYLRLKAPQAKLGLELQSLLRKAKRGQPKSLTQEEINKRTEIIKAIKVLNARGPKT